MLSSFTKRAHIQITTILKLAYAASRIEHPVTHLSTHSHTHTPVSAADQTKLVAPFCCCCLFIAVSQCCFAAKPPATFLLLSCHVMARERLAPALLGAIHPATPDWPLHYCTVLFLCSEVGCTVFSCSTVNQSIDNGVVANEGVCVFVCVPVRCAGTFWHCILCSNWNSDGCRQ